MNLNYQLQLESKKKLILTPELRQTLEILRYNTVELQDYLAKQLLENPLLDGEINFVKSEENYTQKTNAKNDNFIAIKEQSLSENLLLQLHLSNLEKKYYPLAEYLIDMINSAGYLSYNENYLQEKFKLDKKQINLVITTLQSFEPAGIAARDIKECLKLQLNRLSPTKKLEKIIVQEYLHELADKNFTKISQALNCSDEELRQAIATIKALNPKPALQFTSNSQNHYIYADAELTINNGNYHLTINRASAPTLRINPYYYNLLQDSNLASETKEYLQDKLKNAKTLIKNIEIRKNNLNKIITTIVESQSDFFKYGNIRLKPLRLKDIAKKTNLHESTISRTINGKYLATPNGIYTLKFFFPSAIKTISGNTISSTSVKEIISRLINAENPNKPLSDQKIVNELAKLEITLSRRAVSKYRQELGITNSVSRKQS